MSCRYSASTGIANSPPSSNRLEISSTVVAQDAFSMFLDSSIVNTIRNQITEREKERARAEQLREEREEAIKKVDRLLVFMPSHLNGVTPYGLGVFRAPG